MALRMVDAAVTVADRSLRRWRRNWLERRRTSNDVATDSSGATNDFKSTNERFHTRWTDRYVQRSGQRQCAIDLSVAP